MFEKPWFCCRWPGPPILPKVYRVHKNWPQLKQLLLPGKAKQRLQFICTVSHNGYSMLEHWVDVRRSGTQFRCKHGWKQESSLRKSLMPRCFFELGLTSTSSLRVYNTLWWPTIIKLPGKTKLFVEVKLLGSPFWISAHIMYLGRKINYWRHFILLLDGVCVTNSGHSLCLHFSANVCVIMVIKVMKTCNFWHALPWNMSPLMIFSSTRIYNHLHIPRKQSLLKDHSGVSLGNRHIPDIAAVYSSMFSESLKIQCGG